MAKPKKAVAAEQDMPAVRVDWDEPAQRRESDVPNEKEEKPAVEAAPDEPDRDESRVEVDEEPATEAPYDPRLVAVELEAKLEEERAERRALEKRITERESAYSADSAKREEGELLAQRDVLRRDIVAAQEAGEYAKAQALQFRYSDLNEQLTDRKTQRLMSEYRQQSASQPAAQQPLPTERARQIVWNTFKTTFGVTAAEETRMVDHARVLATRDPSVGSQPQVSLYHRILMDVRKAGRVTASAGKAPTSEGTGASSPSRAPAPGRYNNPRFSPGEIERAAKHFGVTPEAYAKTIAKQQSAAAGR